MMPLPSASKPSVHEMETSNEPTQPHAVYESTINFDGIDHHDGHASGTGEDHFHDDHLDEVKLSTKPDLDRDRDRNRHQHHPILRKATKYEEFNNGHHQWDTFPVPSYSFHGWNKRPMRNNSMYLTALEYDWSIAKIIIDEDPSNVIVPINKSGDTALHIATRVKDTASVLKLLELDDAHDTLGLENYYGNTALCIAASSGSIEIAKLLVNMNTELPLIRGSGNATPVLIAATYKRKEMFSYLLSRTPFHMLSEEEQMELLVRAISDGYYDIALDILKMNEKLALKRDVNQETLLHIMAWKSTEIGSQNEPSLWRSCLNSFSKRMYEKSKMRILARELVQRLWGVVLHMNSEDEIWDFISHPSSMLHNAATVGNVEFLLLLLPSNPVLAWGVDEEEMNMFHIAVKNRQECVFSLIYEIGDLLDSVPNYFDGGSMLMLELAAKKADPNHLNRISGAAFQLHRELLWFKEVEKIVDLTFERKKGKETMRELFSQEHKSLVDEGEKWITKTANSCMLVATLIATVVFAAALTVPGGNNNSGSPNFLHRTWFSVFVISDAIALISSATSILLFLSILTSSCSEDDFLSSLPLRLMFGLATLFLSILGMVVAFSAIFFMIYGNATVLVPLIITGMAVLPVYLFGVLQYKLWAAALRALKANWMSNSR